MKNITLISLCVFALSLAACSTASVRVMPGENGINKVLARDIEVEGAEEAAHKAANEYCEKHDREAIFLKEKSEYTGKMDESTRKGVRSASKAVTSVPGVSLVGTIGSTITGDRDYRAAALFKCGKVNLWKSY